MSMAKSQFKPHNVEVYELCPSIGQLRGAGVEGCFFRICVFEHLLHMTDSIMHVVYSENPREKLK